MGVLNGLDLFTGIGGLTVALSPWVRPIAYCENDRYAQGVILSRIRDLSLPDARIWDDVRTLTGNDLAFTDVDIIYGGFPCQDISVAGNGAGLEGKRSGLFYEAVRLAAETRAPFLFFENVPAIRTRGLREIVRALTDLRYDCRWTIVSAAEFGAPHLRRRWFLAAHSNFSTIRNEQQWISQGRSRSISTKGKTKFVDDGAKPWGTPQPSLCRVAHGVPQRVDRIRGLGNAVVPLQAREAFKRLMGLGGRGAAKA